MWDMEGRISHINYVKRIPDKVKREPLFKSLTDSIASRPFGYPEHNKGESRSQTWLRMTDVTCKACGTTFGFNPKTTYDTMKCIKCENEVPVREVINEYNKVMNEIEESKKEKSKEVNQVIAEVKPKRRVSSYQSVSAIVLEFKKNSLYLCVQTLKMSNGRIAFEKDQVYKCLEANQDGRISIESNFRPDHLIDNMNYNWDGCVFRSCFIEVTNVKFVPEKSIFYKLEDKISKDTLGGTFYFELKPDGEIYSHYHNGSAPMISKLSKYTKNNLRERFFGAIKSGKLTEFTPS